MRKSKLYLMVAVLVVAGPAWAGVRIDVAGGALAAGSTVTVREGDVRAEADVEPGASYAIGAAWTLLEQSLELGGQWQQSFTVGDLNVFELDNDLDFSSLTAGARYRFLSAESWVRPWVVGQIGWYRAEATIREETGRTLLGIPRGREIETTDDGFGLNLGAGVDVPVASFLSLGLDLRYHHAEVLGGVDYLTTMVNVGFHL